MSGQWHLGNEAATEAAGAALGQACSEGGWVYLQGDLGAGKTTLVRGLLRRLGHEGAVKSPTYTLVEPYYFPGRSVFHLDLYRLADPEELEWLGIREMFAPGNLCLVEWPVQGEGVLPAADLILAIDYAASGRQINGSAQSLLGEQILRHWALLMGKERLSMHPAKS